MNHSTVSTYATPTSFNKTKRKFTQNTDSKHIPKKPFTPDIPEIAQYTDSPGSLASIHLVDVDSLEKDIHIQKVYTTQENTTQQRIT